MLQSTSAQSCQLSPQKHEWAHEIKKTAIVVLTVFWTCDVQIAASFACEPVSHRHPLALSQLRDPERKKQPHVSVLKPSEISPTPLFASSSFIS